MTAAGEPREAARLRSIWLATLGDTAADIDTPALSPHATYKSPATEPERPVTHSDATLSGVGTLGATLSGHATASDSTLSGRSTLGPAPSKSGEVSDLPGFELIEEVGRGGMGVVFRAHQRSLARDVAIKLIRSEASAASTQGQFVAEALVNGLLDHPNIVPVHELGKTARGEVFLAMKLVGGASWKELLHPVGSSPGRPAAESDLDRQLAILQSVANAIAFAHSKGIVHRDLKPENVMVGSFGEVLVMDWGIAVDVRDRVEPNARTRHKSTIKSPSGTPSYMPPELAEGRGEDIGPWTDTYLLGAILHEILTGRPPHGGKSLLAVLLAASESAPPVFPREVPAGLAVICAKALSKLPADRYRSVAQFQAALGDFTQHRASQKITEEAASALARGEEAGAGDEAARTRRYGHYAEAIAGFRQALALWRENPTAQDGERRARLAFAATALASGDVVLAEAQLEPLSTSDDQANAQRTRVAEVRASRSRARALARRMRVALILGTLLVIAGLVSGVVLLTREQLRSARGLGALTAREANLRAQIAALGPDRAAQVALYGSPEFEVSLLSEGIANRLRSSDLGGVFPDLPWPSHVLAWAPAARRLLFADESRRVLQLLLVEAEPAILELGVLEADVSCGALSDDARFAAAAAGEGSVILWSFGESGAPSRRVIELGGSVDQLALAGDGKRLAAADQHRARIFDVDGGREIGSPIESERPIVRLCFRSDALLVIARDEKHTEILRCDPETGTVLKRTSLASTP